MDYFERRAVANHHVERECPEKDTRKRIIDIDFEGPPLDPNKVDVYHLPLGSLAPVIFRCRGCGWSITEER